MGEGLHPRRRRILEFLARAVLAGETTPAEREIGRAVGLRSAQTIHHHLMALGEEGYVERGEAPSRKRRPLKITERGWETVGQTPLLGNIAAGRGLEAVPADEAYSLARLLAPAAGGERYMLRVVGDSMIEAGIADGDVVVEEESPADGSIVVALIGGGEEVTVKRLFREGRRVRLRAESPVHEDLVLEKEDLRIQGRVLGSVRLF